MNHMESFNTLFTPVSVTQHVTKMITAVIYAQFKQGNLEGLSHGIFGYFEH